MWDTSPEVRIFADFLGVLAKTGSPTDFAFLARFTFDGPAKGKIG